MDAQQFKCFMHDQAEEIKRYKWIESEKAGKDLGNLCCLEWVDKYSATFREFWENSHGDSSWTI